MWSGRGGKDLETYKEGEMKRERERKKDRGGMTG